MTEIPEKKKAIPEPDMGAMWPAWTSPPGCEVAMEEIMEGAKVRERSAIFRSVCGVVVALQLASCTFLMTPTPGHPIPAMQGRSTVFGHVIIRSGDTLTPPDNPGADWSEVGLAQRPELRLYLLRLGQRQVAVPEVSSDGLFCWQLPPGDYLLIGLPAEDVSAPEVAQRHSPLAALRVPAGPGISCAGDAVVETSGDVLVLNGPLRVDFGVASVHVADACAARRREIESRYAPLEQSPATRLMVDISDLDFADPALMSTARARLDASAGH